MIKYLKWLNKNTQDMEGKTVIITGANSGIGFEAAKYLAYLHATIIFACRNEKRANAAIEKLKQEIPDAKVKYYHYDQSSLESIDKFVDRLVKDSLVADVFVANAGIYHPKQEAKSVDGFPLTMGTNYFGLFALSESFKKIVKQKGKIIFVTSLTYSRGKVNDNFLVDDSISLIKQYANSKYAITSIYKRMCLDNYFDVMLMHPGISNTNIVMSSGNSFSKVFKSAAKLAMPLFTHRPNKAALGIVKLAADSNCQNGDFYVPRGLGEILGMPKKKKEKKISVKKSEKIYEISLQALTHLKENKYVRSE